MTKTKEDYYREARKRVTSTSEGTEERTNLIVSLDGVVQKKFNICSDDYAYTNADELEQELVQALYKELSEQEPWKK